MAEFKFPTEVIDLPSKGIVYSKENPLSSGKVEMKYMTAKEEDILTNQSYIQKGTVLDKLLQSLIVDKKINLDDLVVGDKNAVITFKLLTGKDEKAIDREIAGLKKLNKDASPEMSTRLKHMILSVDGNEEKKDIREFVDNYLLARDSRAFREHIKNTQPDIDLTYVVDSGEEVSVPIGLNFFWPDA